MKEDPERRRLFDLAALIGVANPEDLLDLPSFRLTEWYAYLDVRREEEDERLRSLQQ